MRKFKPIHNRYKIPDVLGKVRNRNVAVKNVENEEDEEEGQ